MLGHPMILLLSVLPFIAGLVGFVLGMGTFVRYSDAWITHLLIGLFAGWSEGTLWFVVYWIAKSLLFISILIFCVVSSIAVMAVVASPINEYISVRVERDLVEEGHEPVAWRRLPKVLAGEFLKAFFVIFLPLVLMFIPIVNMFAGFLSAFLIGWDFYDYPLARRGWGFKERFKFVFREFWTILGFGFWLMIPLVHLFLVPLAVAGGTILNVEALARRGLVTLKTLPAKT
jgi:uncharacterized protein involved in cysteine biosynthesis